MTLHQLLVEHPLIPDVHTGIAARISSEVRRKMDRQRPHEQQRGQHISSNDSEPGSERAAHGALLLSRIVLARYRLEPVCAGRPLKEFGAFKFAPSSMPTPRRSTSSPPSQPAIAPPTRAA